MTITEAAYGPEDPDVAVTLNNLGTVQLGLGLPEQAHSVLQRALEINEAAYGPEHHQVAITLRNLADVQWQLGRLEQARVAARRALAIFQRVLGHNHPHTMNARSLVDTVATSASERPG